MALSKALSFSLLQSAPLPMSTSHQAEQACPVQGEVNFHNRFMSLNQGQASAVYPLGVLTILPT